MNNIDKLIEICPKIKNTYYSKYGVLVNEDLLIPFFWLATIYMLKEEIENES